MGVSLFASIANAGILKLVPKGNDSVYELNGEEIGKSKYKGLELKVEFDADKITKVIRGNYSCDCKLEKAKNESEMDSYICEKTLSSFAKDVIYDAGWVVILNLMKNEINKFGLDFKLFRNIK